MTEVQRKYLEWVGFNDYEIQEVETEIKNGEEIFVFEGFQFYAWESGYNKANEWHYVKDGIYPTHSNRVLVFTDEGVGFGIYGLDDKKWHTYDTGFDVIAWKEIVLPELKEIE